ncbi:hypothetical protein diail_366, partial [Diaporthe ilicicola]
MAGPFNPPLTPWAVRFGVADGFPWQDENSSGLHPKYPDIDLRYIDLLPAEATLYASTGTTIPQPSDPDVDRLFLDEKYQASQTNGYYSWQALLFNSLRGNPPPNMNVSEDNWLPIFAKKRWYNLNRSLFEGMWGTLDYRFADDATYSVDIPELWDTIAPAIEVANRLMLATIHHTLLDNYAVTQYMVDPHLQGMSTPCGCDFVLVLVNPALVRTLLDANATEASKAQATLSFALTLCHEMIHAIHRVSQMNTPAAQLVLEEPFYEQPGTLAKDSAWINELGFAWERAIIGGPINEAPLRDSDWNTGSLLMFLTEFPNYRAARNNSSSVDLDDHEDDVWHGYGIPSFAAQAYASDEFWTTHIYKYGVAALRAPKLVKTRLSFDERDGFPQICVPELAVPEYTEQLVRFALDFEARRELWVNLRPWWREKFMDWVNSPYSHTFLRRTAGRFRFAHRGREELAAQRAYIDLGAVEGWGHKFNRDGYLLSRSDIWLDRAIGYLMMTIMPIRPQPFTIETPYFAQNGWTPSTAALVDNAQQNRRPFEIRLADKFGSHSDVLTPRNIPFNAGSDMGTRASLLRILKDEIPNRQREFPYPSAVYDAVKAMFDNVERNAPQQEDSRRWLPLQVNFVLPPWQSTPAQTNLGDAPASPYVPYNPTAQPQQYAPGAAAPGGPAQPPQNPPPQPAQPPQTPPGQPPQPGAASQSPPSAPGRSANSARRAPGAPDEVYYTVGEVGDHISTGDLWILVDDGAHGHDVYNATWADDQWAFDFDDHVERTLLGLKARPGLQGHLQAQGERLGKLIQPMRRQDIRERDGKHGKPLWITIGNDVFDISNFPFENAQQQNLMTMRPGENPWNAIVNDGTIDYDQLVHDLKPYRCAVVATDGLKKGPGPREEFHFTAKEVAWHIYPEATMYTIIRGQVYNLTGYIESHPGGTTILRQWAGRDCTQEFERYHGDADRCLADYDYLRVGRVVPEKHEDNLTDNEVALNGHVYDQSRIGPDEQQPDGAITAEVLARRPDLITAKLETPLRQIDLDTLRANNGTHVPLPEGMQVARGRVEADPRMPVWVCYNGLVYDMTTVYRFGPADVRADLDMYGGRFKGAVIPQSTLATRLQQQYSCRVFGRLRGATAGRPRDEDDDDPGDDRTDVTAGDIARLTYIHDKLLLRAHQRLHALVDSRIRSDLVPKKFELGIGPISRVHQRMIRSQRLDIGRVSRAGAQKPRRRSVDAAVEKRLVDAIKHRIRLLGTFAARDVRDQLRRVVGVALQAVRHIQVPRR